MRIKDFRTSADTFLLHCSDVRSLSRRTVDAYGLDLACYGRFRARHLSTDAEPVRDYTVFLRDERNLSPASVRRHIVVIRLFFSWAVSIGDCTEDPFASFRPDLRLPKALPRPVDRHTIENLFKALAAESESCELKNSTESPTFRRSSALTSLVVKLLIATGLRVGELTSLRLSDIDHSGQRIRVRGKGDKERVVYVVNEQLVKELVDYLRLRRSWDIADDIVFRNRTGLPLSAQALRGRLRTLSKRSRLAHHVTPHRFRHTAATLLVEEGVDIRMIQRLLGHASVATTERYTSVSDVALRAAMARADTLKDLEKSSVLAHSARCTS